MNIAPKNRIPNLFSGLGIGKKAPSRLNRRQRDSFKETQRIWLDMALGIINSTQQPASPVVLGITSTGQGEGKTINCIGIGSAISRETDEKVLLIECDLLRPSLAAQLGLNSGPGVVESMQNGVSAEDLIQSTPIDNLDIVVAGGAQDKVSNDDTLDQPLLSTLRRRLPNILTLFKREYRFILLDMPPLLASPYTKDMVQHTDGTFLTVRAGGTPSDSLAHASELIGPDKLSGVLLIGSDSPLPNWLTQLLEG